jgi:cytochrome P450
MNLSGFEPSSDVSSGDDPDHWWNDPLGYFVALARAGGDVEPLPGLPAPGFLLTHPELIREVLLVRTDAFRRLPQLTEALRQIDGNSILVTEGDAWRQNRRIVRRSLHSYSLDTLAQIAVCCAHRRLARWPRSGLIEATVETAALATEILLQGLLGLDCCPELSGALDTLLYARARTAAGAMFFPATPVQLTAKQRTAMDTVKRAICDAAQGRASDGQQKSLVAQLIRDFSSPAEWKDAWDSNQAHNEILGMLAASRDTTAAALAWTLYFIAANPDVQRCAREEAVASIGQARRALLELPEFRYTEMVIQEALRICPPNWLLVVREAVEDITLGRVDMPKGSRVYVSPYIILRDCRWCQDAERFDPERFSPARSAMIRRFSFFPFGAGPRACMGNAWVKVILKAVLTTLLESFELKLPGKALDVESEAALVVKPKGPLHLEVWNRGRFARGV